MFSSNAVTPLMDVYTLQSCHTLEAPPRAEPKEKLTAAENPRDFSPKCILSNQTSLRLARMEKTVGAAWKLLDKNIKNRRYGATGQPSAECR
jgi:hypothetical protein